MGYIDETTKEGRTIERLIRFMKSVENPSWMVELVEDMRDKLAEYEDLEEQGKLLKLPCAVGDTVYCIMTSIKGTNPTIFSQKFNHGMIEGLGEYVFLTREEAESALKEL